MGPEISYHIMSYHIKLDKKQDIPVQGDGHFWFVIELVCPSHETSRADEDRWRCFKGPDLEAFVKMLKRRFHPLVDNTSREDSRGVGIRNFRKANRYRYFAVLAGLRDLGQGDCSHAIEVCC